MGTEAPVPGVEDLPVQPSADDLRERLQTAQIRFKTVAYILSKVSRQAHSYKPANHNGTMGMMGSLLRQLHGEKPDRKLPLWDVAAEHAAYGHLVAFPDIKVAAERYFRREDLDDPMATEERHKMAIVYAERTALRVDTGLSIATFDPMYGDTGRHEFKGSGVNVSEAAALSDKVDVFRTVRFVQSHILLKIRHMLFELPVKPQQEEVAVAMGHIRDMLSHVIFINGDRKEYVISLPLLYGAMLYQSGVAGDETTTIDALMAARPPDTKAMEAQIGAPDKLFRDSMYTAKICVMEAKDYPFSGEKSALEYHQS